jgi:hypothetical protein
MTQEPITTWAPTESKLKKLCLGNFVGQKVKQGKDKVAENIEFLRER